LELDPEYAAAHRELGFVLSKRNAIADAESHLRKAVALDRNDGRARIYLGTVLWQSKQIHAAIDEFQHAKDVEPGNICEQNL
jgi:Flp pilus assembly protein TadD